MQDYDPFPSNNSKSKVTLKHCFVPLSLPNLNWIKYSAEKTQVLVSLAEGNDRRIQQEMALFDCCWPCPMFDTRSIAR